MKARTKVGLRSVGASCVMMREQWNTTPSSTRRSQGKGKGEAWGHAPRQELHFGLLGRDQSCGDVEGEKGSGLLLFSGANTDQCITASLVDAFNKHQDCMLLSDACATWSPEYLRSVLSTMNDGDMRLGLRPEFAETRWTALKVCGSPSDDAGQ